MVLPTQVKFTYTVPVIGTQTQASLTAIMKQVSLEVGLPQLWGLIPTSDSTINPNPSTVERDITLTFDDGATAAITPTLQDGRISALSLGAVAGWWAGVPVLSFSGGFTTPAPPGAVQTPAQAKATMGVGTVVIANGGSGYTGATTAKLVGGNLAPGGTPAVLGAVVRGAGVVTAVNVTSFGSGYTTWPTVVITDSGGGSGAEAYGALTIVAVKVTNPGFGYSSVPTVNITVLYLANGGLEFGESQDFTQVGWMRGILTTAMRSPVKESPPLYA